MVKLTTYASTNDEGELKEVNLISYVAKDDKQKQSRRKNLVLFKQKIVKLTVLILELVLSVVEEDGGHEDILTVYTDYCLITCYLILLKRS